MNQLMRGGSLGTGHDSRPDRVKVKDSGSSYKPQVLVVDDVMDNRRIVMRRLGRRGINCMEADGSGVALKLIAKNTFDLVLLDIMMPGMSGSEFMEVVRDRYSQSELPIIVITAKSSSEDVRYNFSLGANDYITKPIDWATALPRIMAQISRKLDMDQRIQAYDNARAEADSLRAVLVRTGEALVRGGHDFRRGSGPNPLVHDVDLLELLLCPITPQHEARALACRLLAAFGDLGGVVAASEHRVFQVEGATERVHLQLKLLETTAMRLARAKLLDRCMMASWDDLLRYCKTVMAHRATEQVRVLYLDRKNVLIADEAQGEGTVDHVPVYPREIVRRALELNASAVILVHNHPSGDPEPSPEDVAMTARIEEACRSVGVVLHDHLVIGKDRDASLRALGLL